MISAMFFSCSAEVGFSVALPVSNSSRSKENQVSLSTALPLSSMKAISFLSTPSSGTLSSTPFGSLTARNLPSLSMTALAASETAFSGGLTAAGGGVGAQ